MDDERQQTEDGRTTPAPLDLVRVLVVEDDEHLRVLARTILEGAGCRVATVGDGQSAVASALDHPPDVVVLDINLPRMSGNEVARALRSAERTRDVGIVVVTGSVHGHELLALWDEDPDAVLAKPYEPQELTRAVLHAASRAVTTVHLDDDHELV